MSDDAITAAADEINSVVVPIAVHFITVVFFTTWRALHLGSLSDMRDYTQLNRHVGHLQHQLGDDNNGNDGTSRGQAQFKYFLSKKFRLDAALFHPPFVSDVLLFCLLACRFLVSVVTGYALVQGPTDGLVLPVALPTNGSSAAALLAALLEHLLDNVTQVFIFTAGFDRKF